jgi:hypothetical protein
MATQARLFYPVRCVAISLGPSSPAYPKPLSCPNYRCRQSVILQNEPNFANNQNEPKPLFRNDLRRNMPPPTTRKTNPIEPNFRARSAVYTPSVWRVYPPSLWRACSPMARRFRILPSSVVLACSAVKFVLTFPQSVLTFTQVCVFFLKLRVFLPQNAPTFLNISKPFRYFQSPHLAPLAHFRQLRQPLKCSQRLVP